MRALKTTAILIILVSAVIAGARIFYSYAAEPYQASVEDIIKKIDEYGAKEVAEAFKVVSKKSVDNPKRSYKYVVGILQTEAKE